MSTKTLAGLKKYAAAVGNTFFSKGNTRYFGSDRVWGVYRAPYTPESEGYVIVETIFTDSKGVASPAEYVVYRFEAVPGALDWNSPIGKHPSLQDAESFLQAMGAVK